MKRSSLTPLRKILRFSARLRSLVCGRFMSVSERRDWRLGRTMSEGRDPTIKLFGRKIPLPEDQPLIEGGDIAEPTQAVKQETAGEKVTQEEIDEVATSMSVAPQELNLKEPLHCSGSSSSAEVDQNPSAEIEKTTEELDNDEDHKESNSSEDGKILKKPDKVLPCPRCTSMDTKFCYYNNYNVNQPRHFCKNCQRYWTAGGTMRNVPVGAGRRKNKHSTSSYRALASLQVDGSAVTHHQALSSGSSAHRRSLKENGTLQSGADAPLCESMASALNIEEQNRTCGLGFTARRENREEPSCSSSVTCSKYAEKGFLEFPQHNATHGYQNGVTPFHQLQSFSGPPWSAYHWMSGWSNAAAASMTEPVPGQENGILLPLSCVQAPMVAAPAFHPPTFPLQFPFPFPLVPAPFWGWNGPWNFAWASNGNVLPPSSSTSTSNCSGHGSPTLGKHSRDATSLGEERKEKSLWIPKTLRIDDPDAAAKSSIFATLGIKVDEVGMFKPFPSRTEKVKTCDAKQVLHANPAALSRSQSFHEAT